MAYSTQSSPDYDKPLLGISRCLLGDTVRFDGGHKRSRYAEQTLSQYFRWYPVCPEVESGMSSPRPSIRQVRDGGELRVVSATGVDVTDALRKASDRRLEQMRTKPLRGFIVVNDSPSCGLERVRVYEGSHPVRTGVGVFTAALRNAYPNMPVEESGRLNDARLRENFILRVYTYHRFKEMVDDGPSVSDLMRFHAEHKYLLLAHNPSMARHLGGLVAQCCRANLAAVLAEYESGMMDSLAKPAKVGGHVDALQHIVGFISDQFTPETSQHMQETIAAYGSGEIPLITPITLINHYLAVAGTDWVRRQWYLKPYPAALSLRSRI
ncbi:MAG: DUF523 and DUF1722 domain-containing protein [Myxococcota bacterium]|nr:DUF523 and DUF1722 domain-containing protein [Myxococcota bacterium]